MQGSLELIEQTMRCPCYDEMFVVVIDLSSSAGQRIGGGEICCRPIQFQVECTNSDELASLAFWRQGDWLHAGSAGALVGSGGAERARIRTT